MPDIASSLEQEFASAAQTQRETAIADLRTLEAAGRGSLDIISRSLVFPALGVFFGLMTLYASLTSDYSRSGQSPFLHALAVFAIGAALLALGAWGFVPGKPLCTLTEQGIRVKNALLPWSSIESFRVVEHSYGIFKTDTAIYLVHPEGFTPPKLGLPLLRGRSQRPMLKRKHYETHFTLWTGAKGLSVEALADRINDFVAAAHAREELARLGVNWK